MIFVKASSVWRLTLCVLAIAYVERHEMISVTVHVHAETSVSETLSIPGQIVNAKVPSFEPNKKQAGQPKQQLWLYEGALYDPLDGRKVAKVRGLELVQQLEDTSNLAIDSLLKHPNATYQDSKTLWSQKIFCYTTEKTRTTTAAGTVEDALREQPRSMQESILDSVRVRPRSPRKKVPLDQAVAVYETATTFISRKSGKGKRNTSMNREQDDDDDDDETEVLVHSEWPNGQTMWGTARDCSQQTGDSVSGSRSSTNIDFTVFAKLRNKNSPLYSPDLILDDSANSSSGTRTTKSGDIIVSPKRASLVQFGSSDGTMETKHKFGARETYSYRNVPNEAVTSTKRNTRRKWFPFSWPLSRGKNEKGATSTSPSLYYTRYGEGPPFYAPGRMCMLELRGRPVSNLGEVGPLLRGLILGNSTSNNDQQSGSPAPISNFHWNRNNEEEEEASTEDMKGKAAKGVMVSSSSSSSSNEPAIMSIQRAWNLRERQRDLQVGNSDRYVTTKQLQSRRRRMRQPLALKLTVVDDTSTVTGKQGIQKLTVFAKRGMNCAISIWERIQASTTMESRS